MLTHIPFPALPAPPSWFPGHMLHFARTLPALLTRTDVVLELRDARLPLTSINRNFEGALQKWRQERGRSVSPIVHPETLPGSSSGVATQPPTPRPPQQQTGLVCERIVVFNKRDLVPEWGIEPFRKAMINKFPDQQVFFASWNRQRDIRALSDLLISTARKYPHLYEMNVLVVGMPNVGKSTLLNALRSTGIAGPTAKALRTSAQPGLTRALSTRLKLSVDPLVYAFDSPGVMLPFLGRGERGAERGVKLALIAGIKEGLYDVEALASYLLYRLNVLDPVSPAYLSLLAPGAEPLTDVHDFLDQLAARLHMVKRGGVPDQARAAVWFINWWREEGGRVSASSPALCLSPTGQNTGGNEVAAQRRGWGFDLEWTVDKAEVGGYDEAAIQRKMEECIDAFQMAAIEEERAGGGVSATQEKKRMKEEMVAKRAARRARARATARRGG